MTGGRLDSDSPDTLRSPTIDRGGKRKWIYPDRRSGRYSRQRGRLAILLLIVYLVAPFIKVFGAPLIRIEVSSGIIYALGQAFRFADGFYLVFVLLSLATALAWATSLWGRIWCGYGCPQTVFVEWLIRPVEEWIEGPAMKRRNQDSKELTPEILMRKALKHLIFVIILLVISNVFLAYFVDPKILLSWVRSSPSEEPLAFLLMTAVFGALYFDLVWFREQFCAYLCPYGRFQSVLISKATPTIAFDYKRGEPRGKKDGKGDCIDCGLCVRVCPTGIDIRQGLQLECIQCMRCSDACNVIMTNLKRKPGLIRTASQMEIEGSLAPKRMRLRPFVLFAMFLLSVSFLGYAVVGRDSLKVTVLRQNQTTYGIMDSGRIANYFSVRVVNQSHKAEVIDLKVSPELILICSICGQTIAPNKEVVGSLIVMFKRDYTANEIELGSKDAKIKVSILRPQ